MQGELARRLAEAMTGGSAEPAAASLIKWIMSIAGGSNQIQRNIISERILGLPREPSFSTIRR